MDSTGTSSKLPIVGIELEMTGKAITNMGCNFKFICCSASYLVQVSVELTKKWKLVVSLIPTTISWFVTSSIFYLLLQGRAVKKWKNLRDNYTRLKASAKDLQRSGSAATNNKKWIHMDAMDAFMQFHIKQKPLVSSECCNSNESLLIFYRGASKQHFDMHILISFNSINGNKRISRHTVAFATRPNGERPSTATSLIYALDLDEFQWREACRVVVSRFNTLRLRVSDEAIRSTLPVWEDLKSLS